MQQIREGLKRKEYKLEQQRDRLDIEEKTRAEEIKNRRRSFNIEKN